MNTLSRFIDTRRPRWDRLRELLDSLEKGRSLSADEVLELDRLYRQVNTDMAMAQGRYPDSDFTRMLELMLVRAHGLIYPARSPLRDKIAAFLVTGFPGAVRDGKKMIWLAFATFILGAAIGLSLASLRPELGEIIMGEQTVENMKDGHVWTERLEDENPVITFMWLFGNNVRVSMTAFAAGILLGVGTLFLMLYNGLHLGSALGVTMTYGVAGKLATFVAGHGFIEIFSILMAGAAGMTIGFAVLAPGRLSRGEAVARAGRRVFPLLVATIPILAVAAFVEGFISPEPGIPAWAKFVLGPTLLAGLLSYVIIANRRKPPEDTAG